MTARIVSIGTASPQFTMDQRQCSSFVIDITAREGNEARTVRAMYRLSGIERRGLAIANADGGQTFYPRESTGFGPSTEHRLARYGADASAMAAAACRTALARAELDPAAITHLVYASCTGFEAPGVDQTIIRQLGLSNGVQRTIVGFMGCHAAVNALRVARGLAVAEPGARVLVCATEVCSLHFSYTGIPDRDLANALFADGSAACIVTSDDASHPMQLTAFSARLWPEAADDMSWKIGNHGFEMGLSPSVPDRLAASARDWLEPWLADHKLAITDVGGWAIHPGGPRIVRAVRDSLALSDEQIAPSLDILRHHGNMSSPTILFILDALARAHTPRPWVAVAFGPGLAGEAMLLR